jgi:hypothetical protein
MKLKSFAIPMFAAAVVALSSSSPSSLYAAAQRPQGYVADQPSWDVPPAEFRDVQREGFHDGIEGARKDFDNHRMPDVNNRAEYRHPHVDPAVRNDYREGFRRGYDVAMRHMTGQMPPQ